MVNLPCEYLQKEDIATAAEKHGENIEKVVHYWNLKAIFFSLFIFVARREQAFIHVNIIWNVWTK